MGSPAPAPPLRRNRNFQNLWVGQFLSDLGSAMGVLAYPLLLLDLTHSTALAGIVATLASLAAFVVRLPAGSLADRVDRRRTMVITDAVRAVVLLALFVAVVTHHVSWPIVLVVAIIDRLGDTIFSPTSTAILPAIIEDSQFEGAVAANEGRQYAASMIGPALGGALFSAARAIPFLADSVSYGISTVTSLRLTGNFRPAQTEHHGLWRESIDSLRHLWNDRVSRIVITQAPLINFAFNGMIISVVFAMRKYGYSAGLIGLTQAGIMIGGLLGALLAPRLRGHLTIHQVVALFTIIGTVLFAISAVLAPTPWMALPVGASAVLAPTANAALFGELLRRTPDEMRGRATNAVMQVAMALAVLSPLAAGMALEHLSARAAVSIFAIVLAISAVIAIVSRADRTPEPA